MSYSSANFTEISVGDLPQNKDIVEERLLGLRGGLYIREYPAGQATVNTIHAHLENCIQQGINPDLVIVQAGADCLEDDPQSKMSLTNFSYWKTISKLKTISIKTLILGGGGYNPYITAKAWAGNWLVLNSKEHLLDAFLNNECKNLLKTLTWKNSRVRKGIPDKWLEKWLDDPKKCKIRDDIKWLTDEIKKIKKL